MSKNNRFGLLLLSLLILVWLYLSSSAIHAFFDRSNWGALLCVALLYLCSHLVRMLRLALLTLDDRKKVIPLIFAHAFTAFPSSFFPFKIGEIIRLAAMLNVFDRWQKALAVWINERFGDVIVIILYIFGLYILNVEFPPAMQTILVLFVVATIVGVLSMLAVANIFVYLNRHLMLSSHSTRGLTLLRISHSLRQVELGMYKSIDGRISGFLLLSGLIWAIEITSLSLLIRQLALHEPAFASLFTSSLLASLPGGSIAGAESFGIYQSLALAALALFAVLGYWFLACVRKPKS